MLGEGTLEGEDPDLHRAGPGRVAVAYQPRTASRSCSGMASIAMPRIGAPRPFETSAMILASWKMGRRLDDGVRHAGRVLALEDARSDEHALGA